MPNISPLRLSRPLLPWPKVFGPPTSTKTLSPAHRGTKTPGDTDFLLANRQLAHQTMFSPIYQPSFRPTHPSVDENTRQQTTDNQLEQQRTTKSAPWFLSCGTEHTWLSSRVAPDAVVAPAHAFALEHRTLTRHRDTQDCVACAPNPPTKTSSTSPAVGFGVAATPLTPGALRACSLTLTS